MDHDAQYPEHEKEYHARYTTRFKRMVKFRRLNLEMQSLNQNSPMSRMFKSRAMPQMRGKFHNAQIYLLECTPLGIRSPECLLAHIYLIRDTQYRMPGCTCPNVPYQGYVVRNGRMYLPECTPLRICIPKCPDMLTPMYPVRDTQSKMHVCTLSLPPEC